MSLMLTQLRRKATWLGTPTHPSIVDPRSADSLTPAGARSAIRFSKQYYLKGYPHGTYL
jgi:hypothetical protein